MNRLAVGEFALACTAVLAAVSLHAQANPPGTYTGTYTSDRYGFTVALPEGIWVTGYPDPNEHTGFAVDLENPQRIYNGNAVRRFVVVQGNPDFSESGKLDGAADYEAQLAGEAAQEHQARRHTEVTLTQKFPVRVDNLPARRVVFAYTNAHREPAVKQLVVALRTQTDADPIVYTFELTTTRKDFDADLSTFSKILAGFKVAPVR